MGRVAACRTRASVMGSEDRMTALQVRSFSSFSSAFEFRSFSGAADLVLWVDLVEGLDLEDGVVR